MTEKGNIVHIQLPTPCKQTLIRFIYVVVRDLHPMYGDFSSVHLLCLTISRVRLIIRRHLHEGKTHCRLYHYDEIPAKYKNIVNVLYVSCALL